MVTLNLPANFVRKLLPGMKGFPKFDLQLPGRSKIAPPAKSGKRGGSRSPRSAHISPEAKYESEAAAASTALPRQRTTTSNVHQQLTHLYQLVTRADANRDEQIALGVQLACQLGQYYQTHRPAWAQYLEDRHWKEFSKRPRVADAPKAYVTLIRWMCPPDENGSKLAFKYRKAIDILLDDGVKVEELALEWKSRGAYNKIIDADAARRKREASGKGAARQVGRGKLMKVVRQAPGDQSMDATDDADPAVSATVTRPDDTIALTWCCYVKNGLKQLMTKGHDYRAELTLLGLKGNTAQFNLRGLKDVTTGEKLVAR